MYMKTIKDVHPEQRRYFDTLPDKLSRMSGCILNVQVNGQTIADNTPPSQMAAAKLRNRCNMQNFKLKLRKYYTK